MGLTKKDGDRLPVYAGGSRRSFYIAVPSLIGSQERAMHGSGSARRRSFCSQGSWHME